MKAATRTRVKWIAGGAAGVVVLAMSYNWRYGSPAAGLRQQIAEATTQTQRTEQASDPHVLRQSRLREVAGTTLGRDPDLVRHRFRTALSDLGEQCGLVGVEVDEVGPTPIASPAARTRLRSSTLSNSMKKTPDFYLFRGEVSGTGSLESVLKTMAVVRAQPWVHRVDGFGIKPEDKDRDLFSLRIDVTTLYMPDLATDAEPTIIAGDQVDDSIWRTITSARSLQHPAPPPPPAPAPPKPHDPSLGDWRLTGVIESDAGVEVMITHVSGKKWRSIHPGDKVLGAVLVGASGEKAVFEIEGDRFGIWTGKTLAQRDQPNSLH